MTPKEYIEDRNLKPLTDKERKNIRSLKIYGTDDPMPWDEVFTRIAAGMDMGHIAHIYGHGRKIALWAYENNIEPNSTISKVLDDEIDQRRAVAAIQAQNPVAAQTLMEMANEYAPDAAKKIVLFADELIDAARQIATHKDRKDRLTATSLDLVNLAKAVQTASDTLGHTQRHANAASLTHNEIAVSGFTFQLDAPKETDVIDVAEEPQ